MEKIIIGIILSALFLTNLNAQWSSYNKLVNNKGITLYYKYNHKKNCTDIKFKAENNSNSRVWPSVINKEYKCRNGSIESSSDESVGSTNLKPYKSSSTQPDYCKCKNKGGVVNVKATLQIRKL